MNAHSKAITASPTALEQSIKALLERHDLLNVSLDYSSSSNHELPMRWFGVSFQWQMPGKRGIATANADTIEEAMSKALAEMAEKRPTTLADEALPELAV